MFIFILSGFDFMFITCVVHIAMSFNVHLITLKHHVDHYILAMSLFC